MRDLQRISDNLRVLMAESGLDTQAKLAAAASISQTNVSNIINQRVYPQLDTLAQVACALGVETWQLLAPAESTRLLRLYASSSPADQEMMLRVVEGLAQSRPVETE